METRGNTEKMMLRLPPDAKLWVSKQARRHSSSQNSEIVRCIRERMDRDAAASVAAQSVAKRTA